ncbi:MAG: hypothetical protein RIB59_00220 [Rhodospirillales bacterium]
MASTNSFELYTLKDNQWQLDSVFDSKQDANHEAWRLYNGGHFDGVKVIQETYDDKQDKAIATVVMQRLKGDEKKAPVRRAAPKEDLTHRRRPPPVQRKQADAGIGIGLRIILLCVILLGLIGVGFFIIEYFGG